jgi:hypothetical protein
MKMPTLKSSDACHKFKSFLETTKITEPLTPQPALLQQCDYQEQSYLEFISFENPVEHNVNFE